MTGKRHGSGGAHLAGIPPLFQLIPDGDYMQMKVGRHTPHTDLAGAISREWENGRAVELLCMGRDSVYQAIRAIPVANGHMAGNGVTFMSQPSWTKIAADPWEGVKRSPAAHRASEQVYQIYKEGEQRPARGEDGNIIRFRAAGPDLATELWKKHEEYNEGWEVKVIKTVISLRLIPVQRG